MKSQDNRDTRYYLDIIPTSKTVMGWGRGNRFELVNEILDKDVVRIYITKGQYNKLK